MPLPALPHHLKLRSQLLGCLLGALISTALTSTPGRAAERPVDSSSTVAHPAPAKADGSGRVPLPILHASDVHKFTFVMQIGDAVPKWTYATITSATSAGVFMQKWETGQDPDFSIWQSPKEIPLNQFIPADQQYIQDWVARHSSGQTAASPVATQAGAIGIACYFPGYSFRVDASAVLKGKTVTAIASGGEHFLALCADGTLAAWGQNVYGQLGNGRHGVDAISLEPVLVDTTGALKGKTVTSIGAFYGGSYALCADGSLYLWGQTPLSFLSNKTASTAPHDKPTLFDPAELKGKVITAVSLHSSGSPFFTLCSDGTLFRWDVQKGGKMPLVAVRMDDQGALKGKKITLIGDDKALCADGSLAEWEFLLVRGTFSVGKKDEFVSLPDQTSSLKGKTVVALDEDVLCSDGTVVAWGDPSVTDSTGHTTTTSHPLSMVIPAGQKVSALAGDLVLFSNHTLGLLPVRTGEDDARFRQMADFVGALQGKTIVAIAPNMLLFNEPISPVAAP